MEIIGRNIPQLQSAISSGLDNVSAGIAESVKASGISALDDTFQIFSTSNMGIAADANLLPAVANVAEYTDPITALGRQSTSSSEAASSALPLLQTMQNPKFGPEAELATFTEAKVNDIFKNLELPFKAESESAQRRGIMTNDSLLTPEAQKEKEYLNKLLEFEAKKEKKIEDMTQDMEKKAEAEQWRKLKEAFEQVDQLPYVSAAGGDLGLIPQGNTNGTGSGDPKIGADSLAVAGTGTASSNTVEERGIIIVGGKTDGSASASSNTLEARGIIIVGGKTDGSGTASSNTLEARGIIIVGGKSDGTYLQTIDDTINELQTDPQPETVELLQNQVTAVQDMTATAMKSVRVYQEYSSSLMANIRG